MKTTFDSRSFAPLRLALALTFALGLAACDEKPVAPPAESPKAATPQPAARATEPATGQPAPAATRPEPAPSMADAALAKKVKAALEADPEVNALEIDVVAAQGAVTLYGTARTRASRNQAARTAARVEGVKSVSNKLAVVAGS
jgi:hyperosmotically inducible periplasmic protein